MNSVLGTLNLRCLSDIQVATLGIESREAMPRVYVCS